jgi:small ligand-binding sensory domain FIST
MIRAGVGFSMERDVLRAADEAAAQARAYLDGAPPDWCIAFATCEYEQSSALLLGKIAEAAGTPYVVGCSAAGVLAGHHEVEGGPALAVLAVASDRLRATPFCFHDEGDWGYRVGVRIGERLTTSRGTDDLILVWPDPYRVRPDHLLRGINEHLEGVPVAGGASSSSQQGRPTFQFCGDECVPGAVSGLRLGGDFRFMVSFTQGCRPLGAPLRVTSAHENLIIEIEGKPALSMLREHAPQDLIDRGDRAFHYLFVGLITDPDGTLRRPGDYLVRNIVTADPDTGILALGDRVSEGQHVIFALREGAAARDDLQRMAERVKSRFGVLKPRFGLYFNCLARGTALYGEEGVDARLLSEALPDVPLVGFHCNAELAPISGVNRLLTYTGVLVLVGE